MMYEFSLRASDGATVACYKHVPKQPHAAVQIAHGMGEHAKRYADVAEQLSAAGYAVYANDHRGHGLTGQANLGYMGPDGWNRLLADAYELNNHIRAQHPGIPLILLGHSMGAMMSQQYITRYGESIDALVLSGSPGFKAKSINPIPRWILNFETRRVGRENPSPLMQSLLFGSANKPFESPGATGFEWLSRDPDQVRLYVGDPMCGFVIATGSLKDLYAGAAVASDPVSVDTIPRHLPVYIFSGTADPVHSEREDIERMVEAYRESGLTNVTLKWYEDGRHEMFNETNRDVVVTDLQKWLDQVTERLAATDGAVDNNTDEQAMSAG